MRQSNTPHSLSACLRRRHHRQICPAQASWPRLHTPLTGHTEYYTAPASPVNTCRITPLTIITSQPATLERQQDLAQATRLAYYGLSLQFAVPSTASGATDRVPGYIHQALRTLAPPPPRRADAVAHQYHASSALPPHYQLTSLAWHYLLPFH